ncbi:CpsD/CapB family tyrosine-protein kinase [Vagococcus salmoninarum]|uniref:CpsD/CapB family tyrosine-protein kinase n=1 Tax=Vagococcus salmoninarum TaxID=2739 RepID=UPI00188127F8|nr:CpsD/CapB family tyrosine-protein kinase [Vagococcus salmoninarum]MBE9387806.1 CpsD/CapB family tyrosine-protein kinase [Vagococcus salmoninarum]
MTVFNKKKRKPAKNDDISLITIGDEKSPIAEQYRSIRTSIKYAMVDYNLKTLVVTSSGPSEGKSTTSANLAIVFAKSGLKVLLLDADLRKPTMAKTFKVSNIQGLSTILVDRELPISSVCQPSGVLNLSLMPSGPKPPNPSELLGSKRMSEVIAEVKEHYDLVIFDMPPAIAVTDAQIVASQSDATILVVREGVSDKNLLKRANHLLSMVNANVIGAVYNGVTREKSDNYYYYGE